jgi:hypothetical protein
LNFRPKIEEALVAIQEMNNVDYLRDLNGSIKPEFVLSLVLYHLEKNYHFSGNGVWNTDQQNNTTLKLNASKNIFEETEELDHEPLVKLI